MQAIWKMKENFFAFSPTVYSVLANGIGLLTRSFGTALKNEGTSGCTDLLTKAGDIFQTKITVCSVVT